MAQRRKVSAAPVKQKLRKHHGPKRNMFHCWSRSMRLAFGEAGVLTKYSNKESFALACAARGVKNDIGLLWADFILCPTRQKQDEFLKNIKEHHDEVVKRLQRKPKKSLTTAQK